MTTDVIAVRPHDSVYNAMDIMVARSVSGLPVTGTSSWRMLLMFQRHVEPHKLVLMLRLFVEIPHQPAANAASRSNCGRTRHQLASRRFPCNASNHSIIEQDGSLSFVQVSRPCSTPSYCVRRRRGRVAVGRHQRLRPAGPGSDAGARGRLHRLFPASRQARCLVKT